MTLLEHGNETLARVIALYLPQFHPIPENDEWWGAGFTEWRNVAKSRPKYRGHLQPRLPADLGFYDLRLDEAREAQAALAKRYGVHGFCYYHYWFEGKRVLQRPMDQLLSTGKPDFPFCICWANENWTRRWDGHDREILLAQRYSHEDDLAHIRFLCPVLADPRYIRVAGKPLLIIYRTELLPDPARTADTWREEALRLGVGEIYLARTDGFSQFDPRAIGFDASIEFAPTWRSLPERFFGRWPASLVRPHAPRHSALGRHTVFQYSDLVEHMIGMAPDSYARFRCACPSWDNSPRRVNNATIFANPQPELFERWVRHLLDTRQQIDGEPAPVFVNAWNEWAEGAHLEPCDTYGHSFLQALQRAMSMTSGTANQPS